MPRKLRLLPKSRDISEWAAAILNRTYKPRPMRRHGASGTPEYAAFIAAKYRCTNPNGPDYVRYGGRGIEFRFSSFEEFLDALKTEDNPTGLRPSPELTLDRIDNDGHYEIGNVRWATWEQQCASRRPGNWNQA